MPRDGSITDFYVQSLMDGAPNGLFRYDASSPTPHGINANGNRKMKANKSVEQIVKENIKRKPMFSSSHTNNGHLPSTASALAATGIGHDRKARVDESGGIEVASDESVRRRNSLSGSQTRRNKRIKITNYHPDHCNQDFWSENVTGREANGLFVRKWSFSKSGANNKTVSFR